MHLRTTKKVANDRSVLSTQLLRTSAVLNTGNLYHYISNYNAALSWWKKALSDDFGGLSTAAWGNVIAGHVLMKEYKEAIAEAKKAEKWAIDNNKAQIEVTNFASIVGNRAFAHAALGEYETALDAFKQSYQAQADAMSKINLSLGYVLANQNSEAIKILRTFLQPVTANNQSKIATSTEQSKCGYFVWQMADMASSKEIAVARLYASIGSAFGSDELRNADDHMLEEAKRRVIEEMQQQAGPCKTLFIIPEIKEKLTQKIGL